MHISGKISILLIASILMVSGFSHAFTPNNNLLNKIYEMIDNVYATDHQRAILAYEKLPRVKIMSAHNAELSYYLEKIEAYLIGKLFTFDQQPNFICLTNYVQKGDTIEVTYTIRDQDGTMLDDTHTTHPLAFNAGNISLLPGINNTVYGMRLDERRAALLTEHDAYGALDEGKKITIDHTIRTQLQTVNIGDTVSMDIGIDDEHTPVKGTIIAKDDTVVTIDFNHPHAGKQVILHITLTNLFKHCSN